eukprot:1139916-Prorocentrum_lima.AAC.1
MPVLLWCCASIAIHAIRTEQPSVRTIVVSRHHIIASLCWAILSLLHVAPSFVKWGRCAVCRLVAIR